MSSEVETSLDISDLRNSKRFLDSARNGERQKSHPLFSTLCVYTDINSRSAAANMAIDEALLETASRPVIRFYRWDHPALSFGYFGKFAEVENILSERLPRRTAVETCDIVRRWTGGGIVFHGEDLTYSIVIPASDPAFGESSMSVYKKVHLAIQRTLMWLGQRADLAVEKTPNTQRPTPDAQLRNACFANPVRADVLLNGRKIAGAAQRHTRRGFLQQGSIQNVELAPGFETNFAEQLSKNYEARSIDDQVLERARQIAVQKYATSAWLRRR